MSERKELQDPLWWNSGGKAPFFYNYCLQYWARLGNLVTTQLDPIQRFEAEPTQLPRVDTYLIHHSVCSNKRVAETRESTRLRLLMAGWVRKTGVSSSTTDFERRFAITIESYTDEKNPQETAHEQKSTRHQSSFTREYLIGKHATLQTTLSVNPKGVSDFLVVQGIPDDQADQLKTLMDSPETQRAVHNVNQLRRVSKSRADTIVAAFSNDLDPAQISVDILDTVTVNGYSNEGITNSVYGFRKLEMSQLPRVGERELLYDRFRIAENVGMAIGNMWQLGQPDIGTQQLELDYPQ